jgi:hypothetical protein
MSFTHLSDPDYVIPNILLFGISMFLCCVMLWYVENRSEQFIKRFIDPWLNPIVNKIKSRRAYVVERNRLRKKRDEKLGR